MTKQEKELWLRKMGLLEKVKENFEVYSLGFSYDKCIGEPNSLSEFLRNGFMFSATPEGFEYWSRIYIEIKNEGY